MSCFGIYNPPPAVTQALHAQRLRQAALDGANPATPAARLIEAMNEGAVEEVLQNPSLPLVALEQPDFWDRIRGGAQQRSAESPHCPPSLADWALRQAWTRPGQRPLAALMVALIQNQALPAADRRRLFLAVPALLVGPNRDPLTPVLPTLFSADELDGIERARAQAPITDDALARLAALGPVGVELALNHPTCPAALLERYWAQATPARQRSVVAHPNCPEALLVGAVGGPDAGLREAAAQRGRLPERWLREALLDAELRLLVASNPHLPPDCLEPLVGHAKPSVRGAVARNPALPPALQLRLAADPSKFVRDLLLKNPSATPEARERARPAR